MSLAISAGANVKVVQRMLGHKSAAMTLDTYADLFDDDLDSVAELINARSQQSAAAALRSVGPHSLIEACPFRAHGPVNPQVG
ncbi:hypothetical protein ACTJKK_02315 [Microbacterium sp. 22179]|uniref:hypothetical protein n=1 Tax=Microbacterium sp. 22179 TaxID=3453886 RepID=UPI003F850999